jgi:hypothetical protein
MMRAAHLDAEGTFLLAELRAVPYSGNVGPSLAALADELIEAAYTPAEAFDWVMDARRGIVKTCGSAGAGGRGSAIHSFARAMGAAAVDVLGSGALRRVIGPAAQQDERQCRRAEYAAT